MSTVVEPRNAYLPKVELPETDGMCLDTGWHTLAIALMLDSISYWFRDRQDFYVNGNNFIHYSLQQVRKNDLVSPDFFFVDGVLQTPIRPYWCVWEENGRYPDLIIELSTPSTIKANQTTKKDLYERTFHTHEYCCYDPATRQLQGWRLVSQRYVPIEPNEHGCLWLSVPQLWVGTWTGRYMQQEDVWLRFYDQLGQLVPTPGEAGEQLARRIRQQMNEAQERAMTMEAENINLLARLQELEKNLRGE